MIHQTLFVISYDLLTVQIFLMPIIFLMLIQIGGITMGQEALIIYRLLWTSPPSPLVPQQTHCRIKKALIAMSSVLNKRPDKASKDAIDSHFTGKF